MTAGPAVSHHADISIIPKKNRFDSFLSIANIIDRFSSKPISLVISG